MTWNPNDPDGIRMVKSKEHFAQLNIKVEERKIRDQNKIRVHIPRTKLILLLSKEKIKELKAQAKSIGKSYDYILSITYDKKFIQEQSKTNADDRLNMCILKHKLSREIISQHRKTLGNEMNRRVLEFISDLKASNPDFSQEFIATKLNINRQRIYTAMYRY